MQNPSDSFFIKKFTLFSRIFFCSAILGVGLFYGKLYFLQHSQNQIESSAINTVRQQIPIEVIQTLSTSTPKRVINALTLSDTIPKEGKFIGADLVNMKLYLYKDNELIDTFTIEKKGKPGTAWETPSGMYTILTKEKNHFSSIGKVYMPYSMQFFGNYFIHGRTYYPDGTPTSASFSGGCIKLETDDAEKIFTFADIGTKVFVYDSGAPTLKQSLTLDSGIRAPLVDAESYLVADIDTGDVFLEKSAQELRPIASITKLMTALVTNETISFDKKITVPEGEVTFPANTENQTKKTFVVGDLLYPLLMQSSNSIADSLSAFYGKNSFVRWMNTTAIALNMNSTTFVDPSGVSSENISTADDLFRFLSYVSNKKPFILDITHTKNKSITAQDGSEFVIVSVNAPADSDPFSGGKSGHTTAAQDTMASIFSFNAGNEKRNIAVIILGSQNRAVDMNYLAQWLMSSVKKDIDMGSAACAGCSSTIEEHRKIEL